MNYEELEGKEVRFIVPKGHAKYQEFDCQAIVAGCDPDVGITLVKKDDPKFKLYCLNRRFHDNEFYMREFDFAVESIQRGEMNALTVIQLGPPPSAWSEPMRCAFSE